MVVFVDSSKLYTYVSCPNSVTRYVRTVVNGTEEADNPVDSDGELTAFRDFIHMFMVEPLKPLLHSAHQKQNHLCSHISESIYEINVLVFIEI